MIMDRNHRMEEAANLSERRVALCLAAVTISLAQLTARNISTPNTTKKSSLASSREDL